MLKVKPRRPSARRFRMVSVDRPWLTLGTFGDVPGLIAEGGTLRIAAIGGDGFAKTYELVPKNWQLIAPTDPGRGVRYTDETGAIESVKFETGKRLVVTGEGAELDQSLDREPALVKVELRIGSRAFCLVFGGKERHFAAGTRLLRRRAQRPAACPEE